MSILTLLAFSLVAAFWLLVGGALALWAYYHGSKGTNPIPQVHNPVASLLRAHREAKNDNGDEEAAQVPQSVRRA